MKTRNMLVPRHLIKHHLPHPEMYGESIVELENGQVTDVYTDLKGQLYTPTNNEAIIKYLSQSFCTPEPTQIVFGTIRLRSVTMKDLNRMNTWFELSPLRHHHLIPDSLSITKEFISHAKTMNSDVFMIEIDNHPVGFIGFTVIGETALLQSELYETRKTSKEAMEDVIALVKDYVIEHHDLERLLFHVSEHDALINDALDASVFERTKKAPIMSHPSNKALLQIEYVYKPLN